MKQKRMAGYGQNTLLSKNSKHKKLAEVWEQKLSKEGLGDIDFFAHKKQVRNHNEIIESCGVKPGNVGGTLVSYEYYTQLKYYAECNKWWIPELGKMSVRQKSYFRIFIKRFCDGMTLPVAYKLVSKRMKHLCNKNPNLEPLNSRIYYFKKLQILKNCFIADFSLFSRYMQYLKYSLSANPKSWAEYKFLEKTLPGYHDF